MCFNINEVLNCICSSNSYAHAFDAIHFFVIEVPLLYRVVFSIEKCYIFLPREELEEYSISFHLDAF